MEPQDIMQRQQDPAQHLALSDQVMEIRLSKMPRSKAVGYLAQGREIIPKLGIFEIDDAMLGEGVTVAPETRRTHTVKHIKAVVYRMCNVLDRPHTHQVMRHVSRKTRTTKLYDLLHEVLRLADRYSSDRYPVHRKGRQSFDRLLSQVQMRPSLHDRKKNPPHISIARHQVVVLALCSLVRKLHLAVNRHLGGLASGRTHIKDHHNIRPQRALDVDRFFRGEGMLGPVNRRTEINPLICDFDETFALSFGEAQ